MNLREPKNVKDATNLVANLFRSIPGVQKVSVNKNFADMDTERQGNSDTPHVLIFSNEVTSTYIPQTGTGNVKLMVRIVVDAEKDEEYSVQNGFLRAENILKHFTLVCHALSPRSFKPTFDYHLFHDETVSYFPVLETEIEVKIITPANCTDIYGNVDIPVNINDLYEPFLVDNCY